MQPESLSLHSNAAFVSPENNGGRLKCNVCLPRTAETEPRTAETEPEWEEEEATPTPAAKK